MAYVFALGAPTGPTGMTGMDGLQGALGRTGPVGPTGLTGWGGGSTPGPTGNGNFSLSDVASGTSITVTAASLGTTYYITTNAITQLLLPDMTSPTQITSGAFWLFENNSNNGLDIALNLSAGGTASATYKGSTSATSINVPTGTGFALVYTGTSSSYIVF